MEPIPVNFLYGFIEGKPNGVDLSPGFYPLDTAARVAIFRSSRGSSHSLLWLCGTPGSTLLLVACLPGSRPGLLSCVKSAESCTLREGRAERADCEASRRVRAGSARQADWCERSERAASRWLGAASEASGLDRAGSVRRAKRADWSGWLSAASEASGLVQAGSARRAERADGWELAQRGAKRAGGFELAQRGAKRAGWFEMAQRGERSEPTASSWLSAASEARGLDRAGSARRAGRTDWLRSPSSTAMMPSAKIACPPQSGFVSEVFAFRRDQTRMKRDTSPAGGEEQLQRPP